MKTITPSKDQSNTSKFNFADLPATENADIAGIYEQSLSHALEKDNIRNIAITGPNGTGKSSLIKTYQRLHSEYKYLNISLASFDERIFDKRYSENLDDTENTQIKSDYDKEKLKIEEKKERDRLIENSILQQMIYSQNANTLKYSRFQRIIVPNTQLMPALFVFFWLLSGYYIYHSQNFFLKISTIYWNPSFNIEWWTLFIASTLFFSISLILLNKLFQLLHRTPLKKISMSATNISSINGEVESSELSQESILNKHLDEILYFFEETKCDVVIIEDLDRFESPEIFIKLREINQLINAQRDYKNRQEVSKIIRWLNKHNKEQRPVKFIYALKDDLFVYENRVKFFDFILPVIPVINSSNSYQRLTKLFNSHDYMRKIKRDFIRDISHFVYDLRLIFNIFNEFQTYAEKLNLSTINNIESFFAVIVYKNVYPADFAKLHFGKGALANVCDKKSFLIIERQKIIEQEIKQVQNLLENSDKEQIENIQQLIFSYIGYIATNLVDPNNKENSVYVDQQYFTFKDLTEIDIFNKIRSKDNVPLAINNRITNNSFSFSRIEQAIHPGKSFDEIEQNVINRSNSSRDKYNSNIKILNKQYSEVPNLSLRELIKNQDSVVDEIANNELADSRLFVYLVKEGYLDDNYQIYTSYFYEGDLSKNDIEFIKNIRSFKKLSPNEPIDHANHVCDEMRSQDFSSKYVLNIKLIDYLIASKQPKDRKRAKKAVDYIVGHVTESTEFLESYIKSAKQIKQFIKLFVELHPEIAVSFFELQFGAHFLSLLLKFVDKDYVITEVNSSNKLKEKIDKHAVEIFEYGTPENLEVLKDLNLKIVSVNSLDKYKTLVDFIYHNNLYQINLDNVLYFQSNKLSKKSSKIFEKANYTTLISNGDSPLLQYVENNITQYVDNVLLKLTNNSEESDETLIKLLKNELIPLGQRENILSNQTCKLNNIVSIPKELWTFSLVEEKLKPSWKNIEEYLNFEEVDKIVLDDILNKSYGEITKNRYKKNENYPEDWKFIYTYIFMNDKIDNSAYAEFLNAMDTSWLSLPTVSREKQIILINNHKVVLSEQSFSIDDDALTSLLIEKNFNEYEKNIEKYPLSVKHKCNLLTGGLDILNKAKIAQSISLAEINELPVLAEESGKILSNKKVDVSTIDFDVLKEIIKISNQDDSISILNKRVHQLDKNQIVTILNEIPDENYSKLTVLKQQPKFPNKEPYISFLDHLQNKGIISKVKVIKGNRLIAYPRKIT